MKNPVPMQSDQIETLLRQLWHHINEQRMIVHVPWADPANLQKDKGRKEAFDLVQAFITGSVQSANDGKLLDIDDDVRILAIYKAMETN